MDRMATKDRPIRVAIVGTGSVRTILSPIRSCKLTKSCRPPSLAGLSTAYLLSKCKALDAAGRPLKVQVHLLDRVRSSLSSSSAAAPFR